MDPEFTRVLLRVVLLGGAILVIGAGLLVVAFRAYGSPQEKGRDFRATVLVAALLFFVLVMCIFLLRLSVLR